MNVTATMRTPLVKIKTKPDIEFNLFVLQTFGICFSSTYHDLGSWLLDSELKQVDHRDCFSV